MYTKSLDEFVRGWVIGDFEPSLLRTKEFEVGVIRHPKGEKWPKHLHKEATEYNILVSGKMIIMEGDYGWPIHAPKVFVIPSGEAIKPIFIEDCVVVTIKVPSAIGDKYIVEDE